MKTRDWIPCDGTFIESDVLRWREPAWKPKARKNSKPVMIGERLITAQLVKRDGDWLEFTLISCETKNAETWWKKIPELDPTKPLRRRASALVKKKPERHRWPGKDGEPARTLLTSVFFR